MAAISVERFNMVEWSKKYHNGQVLPEVEMLAQDNQCEADVPYEEANNGFSQIYSLVTSHPTISKSAYDEGDTASKSTSTQETETCTMFSSLSEVNADMAEVGGGEGQIRAKEDMRHAEQMRQEAAKMRFYGNRSTNIRDYDGFATRFNALSGTKSKNVFGSGGSTANAQTSLYGAVWGPHLYGIVPKGTTAGYQKKNEGRYPKVVNGKTIFVKGTRHKWYVSMVMEDWRCAGRVCNIEVADALALTNNQAPTSFLNILHKLLQLKLRLDRAVGSKRVIYGNDTMAALLMRLCMEKSVNALAIRDAATQFGTTTPELHFHNYVFRRVDQILDTEAVVA